MKPGIKMKSFVFLMILLAIGISACQKENSDTQHPLIRVIKPIEGDTFNSGDTITVTAEITDNRIITSVKVILTDSVFIPAMSAQYFSPATATFLLNTQYILNEYLPEGGKYYLQIRAEDGTNSKNSYVGINITGEPKILEKTIVMTSTGKGTINIYGIDHNDEISLLFETEGDYSDSEINSIGKLLYIAGREDININAYDLSAYSLKWSLEPVPDFPMHYNDCLYFDEFLFATFTSEYLRGYNAVSSVIFNVFTNETDAPKKIFRFHDLILVDMQRKNSSPGWIAAYYLNTAVEKQKYLTNRPVLNFHEVNQTTTAIVMNNENSGLVLLYDPYQNLLLDEIPAPGLIYSSVMTPPDKLLLGSEGILYSLDLFSGASTPLINEGSEFDLFFEKLFGNLYLTKSVQAIVYKYPEMEYRQTFLFAGSILKVHFQYNK
jgi:hypothetical protein